MTSHELLSSGEFRHLVARRWRVSLMLTIALFVMYCGFILLVATNRALLARRVGDATTLGIVIGVAVLLLFYTIAQMVGAGNLVTLMFGIPYESAAVIVGVVMLLYVLFGGMIATTWVQIIKAILLLGGVSVLALLVLELATGRAACIPLLRHVDVNPPASSPTT